MAPGETPNWAPSLFGGANVFGCNQRACADNAAGNVGHRANDIQCCRGPQGDLERGQPPGDQRLGQRARMCGVIND